MKSHRSVLIPAYLTAGVRWLYCERIPKARIVHCRRNALDTCVSCYCQDFLNVPYSRDLKTLVRDYLQAMGVRKEKLLPGVSLDFGGYEWRCRTDAPLSPSDTSWPRACPATSPRSRSNSALRARS